MSNGRDLHQIVEAAREHYKSLTADIANAKDRIEHIRLTALAQQAHNLLTDLIQFETGIVYTHTAKSAHDQMMQRAEERAIVEAQEPLDIPEFQSPYKPPME